MRKITLLILFTALFSLCRGQYTDIVNFNGTGTPQGLSPYGSVTPSLTGDTLFAVTSLGGTNNDGCVFLYTTTGYRDIHDFNGADGEYPTGTLTLSPSGKYMFGLSSYGGTSSFGDLFLVNTSGTTFYDLFNFNGINGAYPLGAVTLSVTADSLFFMTSYGGVNNYGNICVLSSSGYTDLHDFNFYDEANPYGSLTLINGGTALAGLCSYGGNSSYGDIFTINTNGSGFADIFDFNETNGAYPFGSLTPSITKDTLYGTSSWGGAWGYGNLYSLSGSGFTDLYDFNSSGGAYPNGDVTLSGGVLYGMAAVGGVSNDGTIFSVHPDGSNYVDLFDMAAATGEYPYGDVVFANSGIKFFGMTSQGGTYNDGVVFNYKILTAGVFKVTGVSCSNSSGGGALARTSGGISPYTYLWSPGGATTQGIDSLTMGSYTVTVTDNTGSTATAVAVISWANLSIRSTRNVNCYGGDNGYIDAGISGGTAPYWFSWSNGEWGPRDRRLSAGTYTITVTDSCGMTATASATITQPMLLTVTDSVLANVHCSGDSTGSLAATATGGASPYTYLWSDANSQTTATATGLSAGTYTITVTDTNGCTAVDSAIINQPSKPPLGVTIARAKNVSCSGSFDGMALALASGGSAPFTYAWSPSADTTSLATGLSAGIYTVQITDTRGCNAVALANISQPSVLTVTDTTIAALTLAIPSGGTPPYSYTWAPGGSTSSLASGISAGTYTLTVEDNNGCQDSAVIYLKQPLSAGLQYSLNYVGSTCSDNPSWANFVVSATSIPNTVFHSCVMDIQYSHSEFYPDSVNTIIAPIEVIPEGDFLFYDYENIIQVNDSVIEIQLGDSTESALTAANEVILNDTAQSLFYITFQIQSPCQSGTVSFTYTLATMSESKYTDSALVGGSYVYSDSAYTTTYTNTTVTSPSCGSSISITDFNSPVDAGVDSILTIIGSGFGQSLGTGQVKLINADNPNYYIQNLNNEDYISWTDNEIQIKVPAMVDSFPTSTSAAPSIGGGNFIVINSCGDSTESANNSGGKAFSVYYNIHQSWNQTIYQKDEIQLRNINGNGGYVFHLNPVSFPPGSYQRSLFYKAMTDWTCFTGMKWTIGSDTTVFYDVNNPPSSFPINYVFFTDSLRTPLTVARTDLASSSGCHDSIIALKDGVMFFNSHYNFLYDSTETRAIGSDTEDFYGVCLHELGHFIGLNHTTADSDLMFWIANGGPITATNRQELWKATSASAVDGAIYSVRQSAHDSEYCSGYTQLIRANTSCINSSGIETVQESNPTNFVIYPNPSNGTFIIEGNVHDYTLVIYNMLGQRLVTRKINEEKAVINLSTVSNGMYFIQEQYQNGIATQKLIITNK